MSEVNIDTFVLFIVITAALPTFSYFIYWNTIHYRERRAHHLSDLPVIDKTVYSAPTDANPFLKLRINTYSSALDLVGNVEPRPI